MQDLGLGLGERLALLGRQQQRQVVDVLEQGVGPAAEDLRPLPGEQRAPLGVGVRRRFNRAARLPDTHPRHVREHLAGRGIDDLESLAGVGVDPLAADVPPVEEQALLPQPHGRCRG